MSQPDTNTAPDDPVESAVVRIWSSGQDVVGTGFLITNDQLVTCAHVVLAALNRRRGDLTAPSEAERVELDFPLVPGTKRQQARVVGWRPGSTDACLVGLDVAVLQLLAARPEGTRPIPVSEEPPEWDRPFRAYGCPDGYPEGVWARGTVLGGMAGGLTQLVADKVGHIVKPGFSGGPVWDDNAHVAIGMVVVSDEDPAARSAAMLPYHALLAARPELRPQVQAVSQPVWDVAQMDKMEFWDVELPASLLSQLYWNSLPASAERRKDRSLQGILNHLSGLPMPSAGAHPLLKFVRELARRSSKHKEELNAWVARLESEYGVPPQVEEPFSPTRYFVAVVIGAAADANGCRYASIQTWKANALEPDRQHEWQSAEPVKLEDVQVKLSKYLEALEEDMPRGEAGADVEIMIEFCLPRLLLVEPVDRWEISHPLGGKQRIGAEYPVIVRDIQRINRQKTRTNWVACWKRMHREPVPTAADIIWLSNVQETPQEVAKRLLPAPDAEPDVVCIGFAFRLGAQCLERDEAHCLLGPWYAGLPVALWARDKDSGWEEMEKLLKGYFISELPHRVFQLRKQAYEGHPLEPDQFDGDLTLVWDDPTRIPYPEHMRGQA